MEEISQIIRHESRVVARKITHETSHGQFIDVPDCSTPQAFAVYTFRRRHYRPSIRDFNPSPDNGFHTSRLFSFEYGDQEHVARK